MFYLINFHSQQNTYSEQKIHDEVTSTFKHNDWWHYLPYVYIIETQLLEKEIADLMIKKLSGLLFFVAKIDVNHTNGLLNKSAWDWINRKLEKKLKIKQAEKPKNLLGTFSDKNVQDYDIILKALEERSRRGF